MSLLPRRRRWLTTPLLLTGALVLGSPWAGALPATSADLPATTASSAPGGSGKIDRSLLAKARSSSDRIEAVVVLTTPGTPQVAADQVPADLERQAKKYQAPVLDAVRSQGDEVVQDFWLKNMVLIRARPATLEAVSAMAQVARIIPNFELEAPEHKPARVSTAAAEPVTWGLAKIGADKVRSERGITGRGVRVAVLDTGIDIGHPDLAGKLVSDDPADPAHPGGWLEFGPAGEPVRSQPHDSSDHGTHVAGTIAGGDASGTRIGVAPDAELMAGLVIPKGSGTIAQVIAGMQWAIAPYDADGNPAGEPADVVSMSLGAEGFEDELIEPVRNLQRAGAFPSFAIGNQCSEGGSSSPGNVHEAVSVGATDAGDNVPDWSCGGTVERRDWLAAPADWPASYVVPDLSAPGVDVYSALPGGGYGELSGTSMATPHVSGTVALMLQARPELTVAEALEILAGTAFRDTRYGQLPNSRFGLGRIDADAAVAEAALTSGVRGVVVDDRTRRPLAGVTVSLPNGRQQVSDAAGRFTFRLPAGTHRLSLSRFGYRSTSPTVTVRANRLTDLRVSLDRTRWGSITGRVVYGPTRSAVPGATVEILDVPDKLTAITSRDGRYTIRDVPEGSYQVVAASPAISRSAPGTVAVRTWGRLDLSLPKPFPTERVPASADGLQGNADIWWPKLSADGNVVAFGSTASNLVPDDTNNTFDAFVTDRRTGTIERVSVSSAGAQGDDFSLAPALSPDGRYVGFNSAAGNLVPGDVNGQTDAFVRDRVTGKTELVSPGAGGAPADGTSFPPSFSADGRYVVFASDATNLVAGDTNERSDIFVRDRSSGVTTRISVDSGGGDSDGGSYEPSISADGQTVAFVSDATDLVPGDLAEQRDVFVRDLRTGTTRRVVGPRPGDLNEPVLSADGTKIAFANQSAPDWVRHLYVHDLRSGSTELASAASSGAAGNDWSFAVSLSADGTRVAFASDASNLVVGDTNAKPDVFVRDLTRRSTVMVSGAPQGVPGDGRSELPAISADGRTVSFQSTSANLVGGDTNERSDVFVHDLVDGPKPRWAVSDLEVSPAVIRAGRPARITAWVKNVGEAAGSYDAVVKVDGVVTHKQSVRLRTGQDSRLVFTLRPTKSGTVTLGALTASFTVRR